MYLVFAAVLAYLLGSVSFGVLTSKLLFQDDIRRHGSGNAGMTNALRTYGGGIAVVVFAGDFLKGSLAVWLGGLITGGSREGMLLAGVCVMLGHLFPLFFGFRGGKGVATAAGAILILNPVVLGILLVPFGLIILFTRYMSLASVTAGALFPLVTAGYLFFDYLYPASWDPLWELGAAVVMGGLVVFMHRANIKRLVAGTESKLGKKK